MATFNSKIGSASLVLLLGAMVSCPPSYAGFADALFGGPSANNNGGIGGVGTLPGAVGSIDGQDDTPGGTYHKTDNSGASSPTGAPSPTGGRRSQAQSAPPAASNPGPSSDVTADEKRMQKKYKANMNHLKDLIAKGEAMMKSAHDQNDKAYKKGRIFKEIGEKQLAEMQANNPFALDALDPDKKKDKPQ